MEITADELAADAAVIKPKLSLEEIVKLGELLVEYEDMIKVSEDYLADLKKNYRDLAETKLPESLQAVGLNGLPLSNGFTITLQEIMSCGITEDNRKAAHSWLREKGFGDIIKNEVVVSFGKDEDSEAEFLVTAIKGLAEEDKFHYGYMVRQEKVHPSTLKAFIKDRLKNGEEIPTDLFKLFVGIAARVNKKK